VHITDTNRTCFTVTPCARVKVDAPDTYRGRYKLSEDYTAAECGAAYAELVQDAIATDITAKVSFNCKIYYV
jgi:hypothetical protein